MMYVAPGSSLDTARETDSSTHTASRQHYTHPNTHTHMHLALYSKVCYMHTLRNTTKHDKVHVNTSAIRSHPRRMELWKNVVWGNGNRTCSPQNILCSTVKNGLPANFLPASSQTSPWQHIVV